MQRREEMNRMSKDSELLAGVSYEMSEPETLRAMVGGAVVRAWTLSINANKVFDPDLAKATVQEVVKCIKREKYVKLDDVEIDVSAVAQVLTGMQGTTPKSKHNEIPWGRASELISQSKDKILKVKKRKK